MLKITATHKATQVIYGQSCEILLFPSPTDCSSTMMVNKLRFSQLDANI